MARKSLPSQDVLNQLLRYEKETGKLFWNNRPDSFFDNGKQAASHNASIWNARFANKEVSSKLNTGYIATTVMGYKGLAHRIIWKMVYGNDPDIIDHIDGDILNNRLSNLRDTAQVSNCRNMKMSKRNTSGITGVRFDQRLSKWIARINPNGKTVHLGCFLSLEEAVAARKQAERKFDFHPNHGRVMAVIGE